ncbi:hypothetical protein J2851_006853 [Azospirillum rugosum]|uniref:Uncharacterized protein n=1 Tax=Azospirillum rugosum TaxID=416170 RepID=A0ABS4SXP3_9PROT|nr:hypothetical protein [Azospirillum rugosum]MDQ0530828.1 hypothetical protein [Azospirillum rugosum]
MLGCWLELHGYFLFQGPCERTCLTNSWSPGERRYEGRGDALLRKNTNAALITSKSMHMKPSQTGALRAARYDGWRAHGVRSLKRGGSKPPGHQLKQPKIQRVQAEDIDRIFPRDIFGFFSDCSRRLILPPGRCSTPGARRLLRPRGRETAGRRKSSERRGRLGHPEFLSAPVALLDHAVKCALQFDRRANLWRRCDQLFGEAASPWQWLTEVPCLLPGKFVDSDSKQA